MLSAHIVGLERKTFTSCPKTWKRNEINSGPWTVSSFVPESEVVDPERNLHKHHRPIESASRRTPGAWKQQRLDTAVVFVHDAVPVAEHPELIVALWNNSSEFQGEVKGVANAEPARPARRVTASILYKATCTGRGKVGDASLRKARPIDRPHIHVGAMV
jgi:hypothetical protein